MDALLKKQVDSLVDFLKDQGYNPNVEGAWVKPDEKTPTVFEIAIVAVLANVAGYGGIINVSEQVDGSDVSGVEED